MVVRKDVVEQIDENRGEMTRTEFVNLLIQSQLKEFYEKRDYATREEFDQFTQSMKKTLHDFLEFFLTYSMMIEKQQQPQVSQKLHQQVRKALDNSSDGAESS